MPSTLSLHQTFSRLDKSSIDFIHVIPNHNVLITGSKNTSSIILWDIIKSSVNASDHSSWSVSNDRITIVIRGELNNWSKSSDVKLNDLSVSVCGEYIISCYTDGSIRIWNWQTFELKKVLNGHTDSVLSVDISLDGTLIVSSSKDNTMRVWSFSGNSASCVKKINSQQRGSHSGPVNCVRFIKNWCQQSEENTTTDLHQFLSIGSDGYLKMWQVNQSQCNPIQTMEDKLDGEKILLTPDASFFSLTRSDKIEFIESSNSELKSLSWDYPSSTSSRSISMCFSPNRYWFSTVDASGEIATLCLEAKTYVHKALVKTSGKKNSKSPKSLVWSNDGEFLFVGFSDGTLQIFKIVEDGTYVAPYLISNTTTTDEPEDWAAQIQEDWQATAVDWQIDSTEAQW